MLSLRYPLDIEVEMSIDNKYEPGTWEESGLEIHISQQIDGNYSHIMDELA